jgi:cell wall-associated NlpC family hydrolase
MATPKKKSTTTKRTSKPATKKQPAKNSSAARATTKKKAPVKRTTTRKSTKKAGSPKSFRLSRADQPFMSFRATEQTVYWLIISMAVLALGAWVMYLHTEIQNIYDTIEANDALFDASVIREAKTEET